MDILGLDIGTSTVSAVVLRDGRAEAAVTRANDALLPGRPAWERAQDPRRILELALDAVNGLLGRFPSVARIGVTGQQHGIVYLDASGSPVSPLYTWQDGRGSLPFPGGGSYVSHLSTLTGRPLATGFGMVTHYYNLQNGLVPKNAAVFCTIHDYAAMTLAGLTRPRVDASDAASFGLFDAEAGRFDLTAVRAAGIDPAILPDLSDGGCLGTGPAGAAVYPAIGDNQASFIGATGGRPGCMLVNLGTGGQFSAFSPIPLRCAGLETRPFPLGGYLLAGSSLCGGRAYALLENFFREVAGMAAGAPVPSCYGAMERLVERSPVPEIIPRIDPRFQGTREDPSLRGAIEGLDPENFRPLPLIYGMMRGMAGELYGMYEKYRDAGGSAGQLFGSGNGLRKNAALCRIVEETFGAPMTLSANEEEAACGAALFAASHRR